LPIYDGDIMFPPEKEYELRKKLFQLLTKERQEFVAQQFKQVEDVVVSLALDMKRALKEIGIEPHLAYSLMASLEFIKSLTDYLNSSSTKLSIMKQIIEKWALSTNDR